MKLNEKYFLNSLLSVAPRCALASATLRLGAYNTAYAVRGSGSPLSHIFAPVGRKNIAYAETLGDIFLKKFEFKGFCCWAFKK